MNQAPGLSLAEVASRVLPTRPGRLVHPSTISRWIRRGVSLADGRKLRLKACRHPNGWSIDPRDLEWFLAAITASALHEAEPDPPTPTPSHARRQELAAVDRDLDRDLGPRDTVPLRASKPKAKAPAAQ
jgi:hypothetical protein